MSVKPIYRLSEKEGVILRTGINDVDYLCSYWFRKPHGGFFKFDTNFTEEGRWQKKLHYAAEKNIVVIGGVGTGKTLGVGMSMLAWALSTQEFKGLNVAQKQWQSKLMYQEILKFTKNTPAEKLIHAVSSPYPKIDIRFFMGGQLIESSLEFMSADGNAEGLFSWRGDWINIEEAGLLLNLEEVVTNLSTRLTGSTSVGRPYLGRFSLISNPHDLPHLWYMHDMALEDEDGLAMTLRTRDNLNVTKDQIKQMLKKIPPDEHERFLDGTRKEGMGDFFHADSVYDCEDRTWGEIISERLQSNFDGYEFERARAAGCVYLRVPRNRAMHYLIFADPGTGKAPYRDSPVIMVFELGADYELYPKDRVNVVEFWWGDGGGSIAVFEQRLIETIRHWRPVFVGYDSTGGQRAIESFIEAELEKFASLDGCTYPRLSGIDFAGRKKPIYLSVLRALIERRVFRWPSIIAGIRTQLTNYSPEKDKPNSTRRMAQDIVMTMAMCAIVLWENYEYREDSEEELDKFVEVVVEEIERRFEKRRENRNPERAIRAQSR